MLKKYKKFIIFGIVGALIPVSFYTLAFIVSPHGESLTGWLCIFLAMWPITLTGEPNSAILFFTIPVATYTILGVLLGSIVSWIKNKIQSQSEL